MWKWWRDIWIYVCLFVFVCQCVVLIGLNFSTVLCFNTVEIGWGLMKSKVIIVIARSLARSLSSGLLFHTRTHSRFSLFNIRTKECVLQNEDDSWCTIWCRCVCVCKCYQIQCHRERNERMIETSEGANEQQYARHRSQWHEKSKMSFDNLVFHITQSAEIHICFANRYCETEEKHRKIIIKNIRTFIR